MCAFFHVSLHQTQKLFGVGGGGVIISYSPTHRASSTKSHELFKSTCCLPPHCSHFNKFNKVSVRVCEDAGAKQTARQADVPNEEHTAGEGGIIQLVLSEVNVFLHNPGGGGGGCEVNTPSLYVTMRWRAQVGCLCPERRVAIAASEKSVAP